MRTLQAPLAAPGAFVVSVDAEFLAPQGMESRDSHARSTTASADGNASSSSDPANGTVNKRLRRTEIERLSRRRRQDMLRTMREEVAQLELTFKHLMKGHAARKAFEQRWQSLANEALALNHASSTESVDHLREQFIELTLEAERLEEAQTHLRKMLRTKELLSFSLKSLASSYVESWESSVPMPMLNLDYMPLPAEEYFRHMKDAYAQVQEYDAGLAQDRSGGVCMGWGIRQYNQDQTFVSSLTKRFRGRDATELLHESWDLFTSESRLQQAFGDWSAGIHCRVLYELNKDVVVVYRTFQRRHVEKRFHSIVVLFRLETDDGFLMGMRTIPTPAVQDTLKIPDKWTDVCTWIHFNRHPEEGVQVVMNNTYPAPLPVPLSVMYMNFFTEVVRWEAAVATPLALKWS